MLTRGVMFDINEPYHRVECDDRIFYLMNPLKNHTEPESGGQIEKFILDNLYPMPEKAPNPLCWKVRCDIVFADFWRYSGPGYTDKDMVEMIFWSTVLAYMPNLKAYPRVFSCEKRLIKVNGIKKENYLHYWKEVSYELDAVGYNESPPNPWTVTHKKLGETRG